MAGICAQSICRNRNESSKDQDEENSRPSLPQFGQHLSSRRVPVPPNYRFLPPPYCRCNSRPTRNTHIVPFRSLDFELLLKRLASFIGSIIGRAVIIVSSTVCRPILLLLLLLHAIALIIFRRLLRIALRRRLLLVVVARLAVLRHSVFDGQRRCCCCCGCCCRGCCCCCRRRRKARTRTNQRQYNLLPVR